MKNETEIRDVSPETSPEHPKDKNQREWWKGVQQKLKNEDNEVQKDIFKETMKNFRKAERLKDRIRNRYESYWDQYNTSRNYNAK